MQFIHQLNSNWFPPTEASLKRALIQRLISELLQNRSEEAPSSPSSDEDQILGSKDNGVGSEFHSARFNPGPSCQQNNISSSQSGQGIELTLLSASSMRNSQCVNDSGLVLRDLFNPGTSAGSLMEPCQSFDQKSSYYRLDGAISHLGVLSFLCYLPQGYCIHPIYDINGIKHDQCQLLIWSFWDLLQNVIQLSDFHILKKLAHTFC